MRFIGGCCGTTPEHIRRIREQVASAHPRRVAAGRPSTEVERPAGVEPVPLPERSRWGRKLAAGELRGQRGNGAAPGLAPATMLEQCRALKDAGIDAVHVLDSPRAQARMGALPAALIIEREVGIETVFHYSCRDRNMLGHAERSARRRGRRTAQHADRDR